MTKKELMRQLVRFGDDDVIVIKEERSGGWSNIKRIEQDGSSVAIVYGDDAIFSDDKS